MKNKIIIIFSLMFAVLNSSAQKHTVSGFIEDAETGERMPGAYIRLKSNTTGTVSNNYGFFSLTYDIKDSTDIIISYIGCSNIVLKPDEQKTRITVSLHKSAKIKEISIIGNKNTIEQRNDVSVIELMPAQLKNLPMLGGESDLMKVLQLTPSVQGGSEGSSEIYVRGGSPDQNLILLDDMPLYYVNHLGGFVSVFNSDAISKTTLIKGGFPSKYGNRLSSVLDVRMKEGNMRKISGNINLGIISSKGLIEGPLKKDKTSFLLSGRRLMYDILTKPFSSKLFDGLSIGYTFYDINAKVNHKFSAKDRIFLSFYKGNDNISYRYKKKDTSKDEAKSNSKWGNTLVGLRWNHIFGKKLFKNTVLYFSDYKNISEQFFKTTNSEYYSNFLSEIKDITIKADFEYSHSKKLNISGGSSAVFHQFLPSIISYERNSHSLESKYKAFEYALYTDAEIQIFENLSTVIGLRVSDYIIENKHYDSVEPRLRLNFRLTDFLAIKPAFSITRQNIHLLTNSTPGITKAIWVPVTNFAPPEFAKQISVSAVSSLGSKQYELSFEFYKKNMTGLIAFKEGMSYFSGLKSWENKIETEGKGFSTGYETLFRKKYGSLSGWLSYTWSKSIRQFENINNGKQFPFKYDRRHDFSIVLTYKVNEKQTISAAWVFSSGAPITLPVSKYNAINSSDGAPFEYSPDYIYDEEAYIYSERNAMQMNNYHRLDINMNFYKKKKRSTRTFSFGIYNLYVRQNAYFYYLYNQAIYDENGNVSGHLAPVVKQVSFFPFVPSISYNIEF